ncbi:hypothetical protein FGO68_gene15737 [Halteria grandinella]|uniref:Natural resistance-associated macrophage protein n=1 Tax=Halteria grandinella TaxID=5974 RepID=A0A8J8NUA0_HALGN|nr:hypothetical protein FGO68_gene15737 [Halteria grandinella]
MNESDSPLGKHENHHDLQLTSINRQKLSDEEEFAYQDEVVEEIVKHNKATKRNEYHEMMEDEETSSDQPHVGCDNNDEGPFRFSFKKFWAFAGPGLLMSIAFLDPGNIAGDLDAGKSAGYRLLWTLLTATIVGLFFQILSARLGVVTQRNLARLCKEQFPKKVRFILWLMTEIAIIGSDIQEVIGSSIALNILFGVPIWVGSLITIFDSLIFLLIHYFGVRKLEAFFAFLISTMAVCFFLNFVMVKPDIGEVLFGTLVPTIPAGTFPQAIGLIGAVIMPHNLHLHSSLVLSRKINTNSKSSVHEANVYNAIESAMSLFISFMISFAVVGTFAHYHDTQTPDQIDLNLRNADQALYQSFGQHARIIWGIGLLAAGQSSTMTGTYAGQFVMEGFLDIKLPVWKRVFITRSIAIFPALIVAFISDYDEVDTYLNILQAIQLPFALIPLLKFTSSPKIMGDRFVNSLTMKYGSFALAFILIFINAYGLISDWEGTADVLKFTIFGIFITGYVSLLVLVIREPVHQISPISSIECETETMGVNQSVVVDEKDSVKAN